MESTNPIIKAIEEQGYEEISQEEYDNLTSGERIKAIKITDGFFNSFFKKKSPPKFPKTFKDGDIRLELEKGNITIRTYYSSVVLGTSGLKLLKEAIKYYEENKE